MFQNLLVAPLGKTSEVQHWHKPFMTVWPESPSSRKDRTVPEIIKTIKKKPKRNRTAFTTEQLHGLEESFAACRYIEVEGRKKLADTLKVGDKAIKIWFQNRRMKEKRERNVRDVDSCSSATGLSGSDTPLHSPQSQTEFQYFHPKNQSTVLPDQTFRAETSPGYYVNTDYSSNFQEQYQDPNNVSCYHHGYCKFEPQQCYNVPVSFSAGSSAIYAYDGTVYQTQQYPGNAYLEACSQNNAHDDNYMYL